MRSIALTSFFLIACLLLLLLPAEYLYSQSSYLVTNYTSKQGLPQNSIKGLAFDQHGFLWLATEGGLARFDGQHFKIFGPDDHQDLRKRRFTQALQCSDGDIVFMDNLKGMYWLSNDQFSTLQLPDAETNKLISYQGTPPSAPYLIKDPLFLEEVNRINSANAMSMIIYPMPNSRVFILSDRLVLVDWVKNERKVVDYYRSSADKYAKLGDDLLKVTSSGELMQWDDTKYTFKRCALKDEKGNDWQESFNGYILRSKHPFDMLLLHNSERMFRIEKENDSTYVAYPFIDQLPEDCNVITMAYHGPSATLVLGTDSRGLFLYRHKDFSTFTQHTHRFKRTNTFYGQCLLDSNTILTWNGLIIDAATLQLKGLFRKHLNDIHLAADEEKNIFYSRSDEIYRYHLPTQTEYLVSHGRKISLQAIAQINGEMWIGSSTGIGRIVNDSIQWEYKVGYVSQQHGIKSINIDPNGYVWFGTDYNLYRLNRQSGQLDSFPELNNADVRVIEMIRGRPFIGTYGTGYFIYDQGKMIQMPEGRYHELTNTHAFVEDRDGFLWIPTNRGLYKTHLDAIDDYLKDPSKQLDYYCYLEDDGIINAEFNGGCSPTHLWLPDGRLSLPTLEGLVVFNPIKTPHLFSSDSILIESIEIDGVSHRPQGLRSIPASHSNITVHFAGAFWNKPYNQYVYWRLEGSASANTLCEPDQSLLSIGHLSPGKHTLVFSRRNGLGADDFVISRMQFYVERPWYFKGWAILFFSLGAVLLTWGIVILNSRTIRKRNIELQHKVDEQTRELLTSNVQLEENVNKLATSEINLRKNIRVRDRLISIITHDILTPLRFISQISRLGSEEKPADQGLAKRALADVQNATHKLFHSTQNLLHWVTYHQENFTPTTVNCSPFAIVEQLMEDFSEMSRFQGNTLINEVPEDDVILTDPRILTIILHNLLSNAIKYTQNGVIRVNSGIEQRWFVLEVIDNGRGMTPDQIEAVRTGTIRQGEMSVDAITAGNGIGLALVADLVEALHGRWDIESPGGEGVRVRLYISLEQIPAH